jgi:hypothetical protein
VGQTGNGDNSERTFATEAEALMAGFSDELAER